MLQIRFNDLEIRRGNERTDFFCRLSELAPMESVSFKVAHKFREEYRLRRPVKEPVGSSKYLYCSRECSVLTVQDVVSNKCDKDAYLTERSKWWD